MSLNRIERISRRLISVQWLICINFLFKRIFSRLTTTLTQHNKEQEKTIFIVREPNKHHGINTPLSCEIHIIPDQNPSLRIPIESIPQWSNLKKSFYERFVKENDPYSYGHYVAVLLSGNSCLFAQRFWSFEPDILRSVLVSHSLIPASFHIILWHFM